MQVDIDKETLRRLRQLCHPDRHGGSKIAETVTGWLNALATRMKDEGPGPGPDVRDGMHDNMRFAEDLFKDIMRQADMGSRGPRFSDTEFYDQFYYRPRRDGMYRRASTADEIRMKQEAAAKQQQEEYNRQASRQAQAMQDEIFRRQAQAASARQESLHKFRKQYGVDPASDIIDAELEKLKRPEPLVIVSLEADALRQWADGRSPNDWDWLNDVARGHSKFNEKWSGEVAYDEAMKIRSKGTHEENKRPF